jgi:ribosomal protein S18 acetylase RimI-like enzyme
MAAPERASLRVEEARPGDLTRTAELHARCLPNGFFARLGPRFLRAYHASFLASPYAIALVVRDQAGDARSFLVATTANRLHYRWVVRHRGPHLLLHLLLALAARPRLAARFARSRLPRYASWLVRYPFRRAARPAAGAATAPEAGAAPVAVLTHVAVDEAARGHGDGRELVAVFLARAQAAGAGDARLVTDLEDGAVGFYERLGWRSAGDHRDRDGVRVREFRRSLRGS